MTSGQVEVNMSQFTWKLKDFSKLGKNLGDITMSPTFQMGGLNNFQWQLQLYPFGNTESSKDYVSLFLKSTTRSPIKVFFEIVLSNMAGVEITNLKTIQKFNSTALGWGCPNFTQRNTLLQKINKAQNDTLIVTCIIHIDVYSTKEVDVQTKILNDYQSLFFNDNFSDLTIVIKKNQMKVHKSILSARSPVFKAMLRHNMKEKNTSTIKITDVSYNIMKELLLFIYSGKVNDLNKNAKALLPVAEKYEIEELKVLCEKSILNNVKIEDACETLSMATLYNCSELKAKIIEFIIPNIKKIKRTPGFTKLIRSNPELFEEIFTEIVEKNC